MNKALTMVSAAEDDTADGVPLPAWMVRELIAVAAAGLALRESMFMVRQGMPWVETWVCRVEDKLAHDAALEAAQAETVRALLAAIATRRP